MKCTNCKYEDNCSLRKIAPDLIGCEGHSKEREKRNGEVKCKICNHWVKEDFAFAHNTIEDDYICFNCY